MVPWGSCNFSLSPDPEKKKMVLIIFSLQDWDQISLDKLHFPFPWFTYGSLQVRPDPREDFDPSPPYGSHITIHLTPLLVLHSFSRFQYSRIQTFHGQAVYILLSFSLVIS